MPETSQPGSKSFCIGLGEVVATSDPQARLTILGLGSCIAVCVYTESPLLGIMAHVVLPAKPPGSDVVLTGAIAKYADVALPHLVHLLEKARVPKRRAKIVLCGGASIFKGAASSEGMGIGARNLEALRREIGLCGLAVECEDVGGTESRTVHLDIGTGQVIVRSMRQEERVLASLRQDRVSLGRRFAFDGLPSTVGAT